jgi:hypothetical protein
MTDIQLSLFPESPWELLAQTNGGTLSHARRRQPPDGAVRLLRELARRGLEDEDALVHAAALVLALDQDLTPTKEDR